jgi:hypothetical protein
VCEWPVNRVGKSNARACRACAGRRSGCTTGQADIGSSLSQEPEASTSRRRIDLEPTVSPEPTVPPQNLEGIFIRIPSRQNNVRLAQSPERQSPQHISGASDPMSISSAGNNAQAGNSPFLPSNEDLGRFVTELSRFIQEDRLERRQWQEAAASEMQGIRRAMRELTAEVTTRLEAPQEAFSEHAEASRRWWQNEADPSNLSRSSRRKRKDRK